MLSRTVLPEKHVDDYGKVQERALSCDTTFGNKTVDVRITFEVSAKSVEDAYKTGSKFFGFIIFMEHMKNHI